METEKVELLIEMLERYLETLKGKVKLVLDEETLEAIEALRPEEEEDGVWK
jgi:hypothetical protein